MRSPLTAFLLAAIMVTGPAQAATILFDGNLFLVDPLGAETFVEIDYEMSCGEYIRAGGNPTTGLNIPINYSSDDAAVVFAGPATLDLPADTCTGASPTQTITTSLMAQLTSSNQARGLVPVPITVEATFPGASEADPVEATNHTSNAIVDFLGSVTATVGLTGERDDSKRDGYNVTITNLGNAPTVVTFSLQGEEADETLIVLPGSVTIGSAQHGQENVATAQLWLSRKADPADFVVEISPASAESSDKVGPLVTVQLEGAQLVDGAVETPSVGPAVLLGTLAAAALVARRRI